VKYLALAVTLVATTASANDYHKAAARYAAGCVVTNIYLVAEGNGGSTTWVAECGGLDEAVIVCDYGGQCRRVS